MGWHHLVFYNKREVPVAVWPRWVFMFVLIFILIQGVIIGASAFWLWHSKHECITDTQCTEMHNGQPGYGG